MTSSKLAKYNICTQIKSGLISSTYSALQKCYKKTKVPQGWRAKALLHRGRNAKHVIVSQVSVYENVAMSYFVVNRVSPVQKEWCLSLVLSSQVSAAEMPAKDSLRHSLNSRRVCVCVL